MSPRIFTHGSLWWNNFFIICLSVSESSAFARLFESKMKAMSRPPQDIDVLAVLDIEIPYSRPQSPTLHPWTLLTAENMDVRDDFWDGNEGFKYPGWRGRRRPEEPWLWDDFSWLYVQVFCTICGLFLVGLSIYLIVYIVSNKFLSL